MEPPAQDQPEGQAHPEGSDFPEIHDHSATAAGRAFLLGGLALGLLLVIALLTHGFGLFAGHGGSGEEAPLLVHQGNRIFVPESSPLRQRLTVMAAAAQPESPLIHAPGIVESDPARTVTVLPPGTGRVHELKVALGDRVQRGQLLALIDSPDVAQAYDDNDKAASAATLSARILQYQEAQVKIGAASQRDLEQARSDNEQAQAEWLRSREHLRAMGAAEDARGEARLLALRAPVPGSVTALATAAGATINDDTQPVMTVADLSVVWVTALVAEKDLTQVKRDQDADVAVDAYSGRTLHGKVLFVSDVLEADSHRNKVRIAFANPDYALRPNMFATVTLRGEPRRRVVLPSSALLMNNDRTSVFVATAPWTFERRAVEALLEESSTVTIAAGVEPGEQVVVRGGILLND
jgi:cobalt-zinc-cadmium efflux system membrane fusion protein